MLGEVVFCLNDELVRRGGTTCPVVSGSVNPRGDGGGGYKGRAQGKKQGKSGGEQHIVELLTEREKRAKQIAEDLSILAAWFIYA